MKGRKTSRFGAADDEDGVPRKNWAAGAGAGGADRRRGRRRRLPNFCPAGLRDPRRRAGCMSGLAGDSPDILPCGAVTLGGGRPPELRMQQSAPGPPGAGAGNHGALFDGKWAVARLLGRGIKDEDCSTGPASTGGGTLGSGAGGPWTATSSRAGGSTRAAGTGGGPTRRSGGWAGRGAGAPGRGGGPRRPPSRGSGSRRGLQRAAGRGLPEGAQAARSAGDMRGPDGGQQHRPGAVQGQVLHTRGLRGGDPGPAARRDRKGLNGGGKDSSSNLLEVEATRLDSSASGRNGHGAAGMGGPGLPGGASAAGRGGRRRGRVRLPRGRRLRPDGRRGAGDQGRVERVLLRDDEEGERRPAREEAWPGVGGPQRAGARGQARGRRDVRARRQETAEAAGGPAGPGDAPEVRRPVPGQRLLRRWALFRRRRRIQLRPVEDGVDHSPARRADPRREPPEGRGTGRKAQAQGSRGARRTEEAVLRGHRQGVPRRHGRACVAPPPLVAVEARRGRDREPRLGERVRRGGPAVRAGRLSRPLPSPEVARAAPPGRRRPKWRVEEAGGVGHGPRRKGGRGRRQEPEARQGGRVGDQHRGRGVAPPRDEIRAGRRGRRRGRTRRRGEGQGRGSGDGVRAEGPRGDAADRVRSSLEGGGVGAGKGAAAGSVAEIPEETAAVRRDPPPVPAPARRGRPPEGTDGGDGRAEADGGPTRARVSLFQSVMSSSQAGPSGKKKSQTCARASEVTAHRKRNGGETPTAPGGARADRGAASPPPAQNVDSNTTGSPSRRRGKRDRSPRGGSPPSAVGGKAPQASPLRPAEAEGRGCPADGPGPPPPPSSLTPGPGSSPGRRLQFALDVLGGPPAAAA
ncbi:hypothetical protein THAOC_33989, partial [Thalassiosira oceanica]